MEVVPSDPGVSFVNLTGPAEGPTFNVQFTGDGRTHVLDLLFRFASTGDFTGSIPVAINTGYLYQVRAVDPDGNSLTYSLSQAPAGMQIDASSGLITWYPTAVQLGQNQVTVRVEDGRGGSDTQTFTVNVTTEPAGGIKGTVFNDLNGDGSRDLSGSNVPPATLSDVPGTSDPYLAGMPDGSTANGGDTVPAQTPYLVPGLTLTPGSSLMFTTLAGVVNSTLPDGGTFTSHSGGAENGISDIVALSTR